MICQPFGLCNPWAKIQPNVLFCMYISLCLFYIFTSLILSKHHKINFLMVNIDKIADKIVDNKHLGYLFGIFDCY